MKRQLLEAYAAQAVVYEDVKARLQQAREALDSANFEAVHDDDGDVALPVAITVEDRVVVIDDVREEYNYHLSYTIAERLH